MAKGDFTGTAGAAGAAMSRNPIGQMAGGGSMNPINNYSPVNNGLGGNGFWQQMINQFRNRGINTGPENGMQPSPNNPEQPMPLMSQSNMNQLIPGMMGGPIQNPNFGYLLNQAMTKGPNMTPSNPQPGMAYLM